MLSFGIISAIFGLQASFIVVGIAILIIAVVGIIKRFYFFHDSQ